MKLLILSFLCAAGMLMVSCTTQNKATAVSDDWPVDGDSAYELLDTESQFISPDARSAHAQYVNVLTQAEGNYKNAVIAARNAYLRELKDALTAAMRAQNLEEAVRIDGQIKKLTADRGGDSSLDPARQKTTGSFTVDARKHHQGQALATGLHVRRGQRFSFAPDLEGQWHPGRGDWCDYRGQYPPDMPHQRMHMRLNDVVLPIVNGMVYVAPSDGEIELFCWDQKPYNNKGGIRVDVVQFR